MDGGCDCGKAKVETVTVFGAQLQRLVDGIRRGAPTAELVAACKASMGALPVLTLADAARALDVELAALEAEGPGKVWRIAIVSSVRDLLAELASAGRSAALLPAGADDELVQLEASWLTLLDGGDGDPAVAAAWQALLSVADAPAQGLTGILVKLRVLLRHVADTAAIDPDGPEHRLLTSTREAVERLAGAMERAEVAEAQLVDTLFLAEAEVLAPLDPPAAVLAAGSRAGGVSETVARRVFTAMLGAYQRARGA